MFAIVKFEGEPFPTVFRIDNSGHVYDLSTMKRVEWALSGHITSDGKFVAHDQEKVAGDRNNTVIRPYVPGDPDPFGR